MVPFVGTWWQVSIEGFWLVNYGVRSSEDIVKSSTQMRLVVSLEARADNPRRNASGLASGLGCIARDALDRIESVGRYGALVITRDQQDARELRGSQTIDLGKGSSFPI